jgi:hypothetical protein
MMGMLGKTIRDKMLGKQLMYGDVRKNNLCEGNARKKIIETGILFF